MSALTRIFNNQIYNSTIVGYQKIAAGTITGSLFSSNVTVPGDLLISGNLFVLGTSSYTTIASTNTYVNDPLVVMNNGFSGSNTYDEGLIFNRGSSQNQAIIWSEAFGEFRLIATNETGTTYGNITAAGLARLSIGSLNVPGQSNVGIISATGAISGASLNVSGNVLSAAGVFNTLTVNGNESVTGYLNVTGNVMASTVVATTGAFSGNVIGGLARFAALNSTPIGNATPASAALTSLTASGLVTFTNTTAATAVGTGAVQLSGGASILGNLFVGGNINFTGNAYSLTGNLGIFYGDASGFGALYAGVTGYTPLPVTVIQSAGNYNGYVQNNFENTSTGNQASTDWVATSGDGTDITNYIDLGITASAWNGTQDNSLTNAVGGNDGYLYVQGNVASSTGGNLTIGASTPGTRQVKVVVGGNTASSITAVFNNTGTAATSTSTGALTVAGGVGVTGAVVAGQLNTTGNVLATAGIFNALTVNGNETVTGYLNVTGNVLSTGAVHNSLTVNGNETITGYLNVTGNVLADAGTVRILNVNNTLWANSTTATTTQGTGALIVPTGGISVAGAANIAGATTINGATQLNNTLTVGGLSYYTNTTNATEPTGTSGALQIKGGTSIAKDLWVGGNIYASNIYGVTHQVITVQDPLVYFDAANTYPYNYDIGFYSNFVGPNPIDNTGNVYQHSGVVRDNADNTWKFFSNVRSEPSGTGVAFNGDTIYDPVRAGNLVLTYTQAATSTTTGALQVAGGAGIAGTVVAAQLNSTGNVLGQAGVFNALTVNGNESVTGYLNVTGNVMTAQLNAGQINTTGNILSTGAVHNSLTVNGNESVTGYLNVTGNVMAAVVTASQLNTTGNVLGAAATFSSATINGNESVTGYLNVTGNIMGSAATFSSVLSNGVINTTSNVLATAGVFNSLTVNGNESVTGYLNVSGNVLTTRLDTGAIGATGIVWANASVITDTLGEGAVVAPNGGASFNGNVIVNQNVYAGPQAYVYGAGLQAAAFLGSDANQYYIQNGLLNLDNRGSSDYVAYSSNGNDSSGWSDFGFTGNAFSDPAYTITGPGDGYFIVRPDVAGGGNLVLSTSELGTYKDIVFGVGSFLSTAEVMRFHGNVGTTGNAWLKYTTVSTTPNTGALRVDGGIGLAGNLRAGGGAVINNSQTADPFQVKGVATTSLIYADTAQGAVVIGGSNVATQLGSTLKINGTDSMLLPVGTTGQRPGATGNIDVAGMIRFNTTSSQMEFYDGSAWATAGSVFTVISDRQFAGNVAGGYGNVDGTNTTFTIQANSTTSGTIVSINGILQFPVLAYDVSSTTLTFTEPPAPTDVIDVRVLATTSTISSLANGNGLNQVIAGNDGIQVWTGVSATTERILVNQVGDVNLLDNNKVTYTQSAVNIVANNTPYVISTWSQTDYSTAKYVISAKKGATNFESMEALVITDGAGNAYVTTYAIVNNGTLMGTLSANVLAGNVNVWYSTTTNMTNANVKAMGTYIV